MTRWTCIFLMALIVAGLAAAPAHAHALRTRGQPVMVADSTLTVTPSRDWNLLSERIGKQTETWTIDGEQLNAVTLFAGIEPDKPLVRERNRKREPMPRFTRSTLLVEVPELLESTYRISRQIGAFTVTAIEPARFLDRDGVMFRYAYVDRDGLTRQGEAHAVIAEGRLYMMTFDAPKLHFFDAGITAYRVLAQSARLP